MSRQGRAVDSFKYLSPASATVIRSMITRARRGPAPFVPLRRPLEEATIALVSTAGISLKSEPPFDTEGERRNPWWGDPSHRVIPRTATALDVVVSHLHIETQYLYEDINVALPLERLAELERQRRVGRSASSHYAFVGYLLDPSAFLLSAVPAMIERMQSEGVDAVLFIPV